MPRVPVLPEVQSSPLGAHRVGIDPAAANSAAVTQGLQQLGAGVSQAGNELERVYRIEKQKAQAVAVTDAETAFSHAITSSLVGDSTSPTDAIGAQQPRKKGFLQLRGQSAAAQSAETIKGLQTQRDDISQKLQDAEARQLFLQRSAPMLESALQRVESHTGAEVRAAQEASLKGRMQAALDAISTAGVNDGEVTAKQLADVEGPIRALALAPDAALADFKSQAAALRLEKRIDAKDWRGAEALYEAEKATLGTRAAGLEKALTQLRIDGQAESLAQEVAGTKGVRRADGMLDVDKAMAAIESKVSVTDPQLRNEVRTLVRQRIADANHAWQQDTDAVSRQATASANTNGWTNVPASLKAALNFRNPALYRSLMEDADARARRAASDSAESRREQADANRLAWQQYMTLPQDERATLDVGVFVGGLGLGVDKLGRGAIEVQQRRDKDAVQSGQSVREESFVQFVRSEASGIVSGKENVDALLAEARIAHDRFVQDYKRQPNREEEKSLTRDLLQQVVKEGVLWNSTQFEFKRRAAERKDAAKKQPASAPAATGTVPASATRKPSAAERAAQLAKQGLSKSDIAKTLNAEGY